jgi:DNA polymerase
MQSELNSLIAEIKENVLFLQELGVSGLDVDLPVLQSSKKAEAILSAPVEAKTRPREKAPPAAETKNSPSSSLGDKLAAAKLSTFSAAAVSETKPAAEDPPLSFSTQAEMKQDTEPTESLFGDISPTNELAPSEETLEGIHRSIDGCRLCRLWEGRTQIVNSTGNPKAKLMFIGEAPGADEDAQGLPFVGRAGQLLTKIIEAMGLNREDVFIGNINRCRPPGNRQPQADEAATCKPFLLREIAVVRPKVIVVLGNTAMQNLLETKMPIGKLRGNFQDYFGIKVMPTFHPAYLLRDPHKKREVWEDMKKVKAALDSE